MRTPSPSAIANPISFAAGAANLANRLRQHCGTGISSDRDTTPPRRDVAGLCASLPTLPPRTAATMAENPRLSGDGGETRRETDCLLEGSGFELPVPRQIGQRFQGFVRGKASADGLSCFCSHAVRLRRAALGRRRGAGRCPLLIIPCVDGSEPSRVNCYPGGSGSLAPAPRHQKRTGLYRLRPEGLEPNTSLRCKDRLPSQKER